MIAREVIAVLCCAVIGDWFQLDVIAKGGKSAYANVARIADPSPEQDLCNHMLGVSGRDVDSLLRLFVKVLQGNEG
jgi:hypothetical protein